MCIRQCRILHLGTKSTTIQERNLTNEKLKFNQVYKNIKKLMFMCKSTNYYAGKLIKYYLSTMTNI